MSKPAAAESSISIRPEWKWMIPIMAVCLVLFARSLSGAFVYDDGRQILRNPLIQDIALVGKALTSDVWAFQGDGTIAASNYWRPTFTAWHILNFRLFGTNPFGWHLLNLILHTGVCLLVYGLLRRWSFTSEIALTIVIIFAVHPIHVESVAWISGSPDLLFAIAFLGSLWFAQKFFEKRARKDLAVSLLLYAVALGAKEIGIICLPIYYLVLSSRPITVKQRKTLTTPLLLYAAIATGYFLARLAVLGAVARPPEGAVGLGAALLSVPLMFAFYLRQVFFPYLIAVNYPLQPITQIGFGNFVLPLIISVTAIAAMIYLSRKTNSGQLALALFALPLLPAMNATAFPGDQIVHDRYLYLPLLGVLMLLIPFAARFFVGKRLLIAGSAVSLLLCIQTFVYERAWASNLSLWEWTSRIDSSSSTANQYASALAEQGQNDEAIRVLTDSINASPTARNRLSRARVLMATGRYREAEPDLLAVLALPPEQMELYTQYQTYEALGITYSDERRYDAAISSFREARQRLPVYFASLTVDLAIVLYQQGQKADALRELEGAQNQARQELLPEAKSVFLRLGMLYGELGKANEARAALVEYLRLTASINDKSTLANRDLANQLLQSMNQ